MKKTSFTRKEFIIKSGRILLGVSAFGLGRQLCNNDHAVYAHEATMDLAAPHVQTSQVVSIVKIKRGKIRRAVEEAIDLLGGIQEITKNKQRIMLKPNLLSENPRVTTKPEVVRSLAILMKKAGKEVLIGEGSAAAWRYNISFFMKVRHTKKQKLINQMQEYVFDELGYREMARKLDVPLVNLHSGEMVSVSLPDGLAYKKLCLHRSLADIDLLCSVPMMKTHALASVTLGMKNLVGLYPGTVYGTVRSLVHDHASACGSPGVAYETIDMVRANKLGLVVVDGSSAMEGNGPTEGSLIDMNLIVAGTNPLAADMVAARIMGFEPHEVPTFIWAQRIGMKPGSIRDIEIRGERLEKAVRPFKRPKLYRWDDIRGFWGAEEM